MYVEVVKIPQIFMYVNKETLHKIYICVFRQKDTLDMHVCKQKILQQTYICMFRQKDTLDMHVYSKNTSQKYTHVQVAKYLMKKKGKNKKKTRKRNKKMIKRKQVRKKEEKEKMR